MLSMETNERVTQLENEVKILKNEIQAVLLDLRDKYLEAENPFNESTPPGGPVQQQIIIDRAPATSEGKRPAEQAKAVTPEPKAVIRDDIPKSEEPAAATAKKESKPDTTHEEVNWARRTEAEQFPVRPSKARDVNHNINLVTIGGLASWADESVRKLGRQRTETILDIAEVMGLLPPDLGRIVTKLINIEADEHAEALPVRSYLDSLLMLTSLLGKDNRTEEALLSIIPREDSHR
jgi:hypothetical protein